MASDRPAPEHAERLALFGRFVGSWDVVSSVARRGVRGRGATWRLEQEMRARRRLPAGAVSGGAPGVH